MNADSARVLIAFGALIVLGAVNYSIYGKEQVIAAGETVYVELLPVDPRSLMQGDYMALRFGLAEEIERARETGALHERDRSAPLRIDARRVAQLGPTDEGTPSIRFRIRNGEVWLGTNAYFFEEGTAQRFEQARYGEFRLDGESGEAVLIGLADEHLRPL